MYDANASYEDNYTRGPQAKLNGTGKLPRVKYLAPPRFRLWGMPLDLPLGIPAGPLLNSSYVCAAFRAGFSVPTYKTVRSRSWPSHPYPNVVRIVRSLEDRELGSWDPEVPHLGEIVGEAFVEDNYRRPQTLSITNSFGVPSQTPSVWIEDFLMLGGCLPPRGGMAALSFQGTKTDRGDFEGFVSNSCEAALLARQALRGLGPNAPCLLEINLSCPNEKGAPIYADIESTVLLLKSVFRSLRDLEKQENLSPVPLVAKIGHLKQTETLRWLEASAPFLNGVSAINTIPGNVQSASGEVLLGAGQKHGGVCGDVIRRFGLEMTSRLAHSREKLRLKDFAVFGVGGVMEAGQVCQYLDAGADLVQSATGAMWNLELASETASRLGVAHELAYL